jgi:septal ring factor EnvC (AmiA/AmiB activator)
MSNAPNDCSIITYQMKYLFLYLAIAASYLAQAQNAEQTLNTIDGQFKELIETSNNFKEYKVIKEAQINTLWKNTNEHIEKLNTAINSLENSITSKDSRIVTLENKLAAVNKNLSDVNAEKDSMNFLGIQTDKGVYNTLVWSIVGSLAFLFIFMSLRFKSSNTNTKAANKQLQTTEEELEELRRKSIEKEQKLGRQLQDERNKLSKIKGDKF